jgi:hypothetical protein
MKHAYLILAHNNLELLKKLLILLDDSRNDIYIHFDAKTKNIDEKEFQTYVEKSNLHFLCDRINVKWGHVSFVQAELSLFKAAFKSSKQYSYYHLISGVDLPIKTQDCIHNFFSKNQGKEFIGFANDPYSDLVNKVTKIHIATKHFKDSPWKRKIWFFFDKLFVKVQYLVGYNYVKLDNCNYRLAKGCNWVSLTNDFVGYLISKENECLRNFKYSICPDEIYKHTVLVNSSFANSIFFQDNDEYKGCMRYVDWNKGNPHIFDNSDFNTLINSDKIFARKFDSKNSEIIKLIFDFINKKQLNENVIHH